ncbi:MAG: hypothetical protein ABW032_07715 [Burkholderiaceae bacterium]
MNAPHARVRAAAHWRVAPPFAAGLEAGARIDLGGRLCGAQLARACADAGFEPQALVVVSTIMSQSISMQPRGQARFLDAVERACGLRPQALMNAYMCVGWAFALRHFVRHTDAKRLAVAIVDLDVHNLDWHLRHPVIGPSGFGVSTLLFELPDDRGAPPVCSGPHANSAFNDFVMALKAHQARHGAQPTFIPFTVEALAATARRVLAEGSLGPNRNAAYGHCFGADPWIGLIEWLAASPPDGERTAVAGAIGFNGYYGFAPVRVAPCTRAELRLIDGAADALERAIAEFSPTPIAGETHPPLEFLDA